MITISYEKGVFRISDLSIITKMLDDYLNQSKVKESSPDFTKIVITPNVFKFIIVDLIKEKKIVKTFCKECDRQYFPDQIRIEKVETYPETQSTRENKPENKIGRFGGEKLICPKCHELLSVVRWIYK